MATCLVPRKTRTVSSLARTMHLLGDEPPGDRVLVAIEGDAEHLGDAGALDVVGVEGRVGERLEPAFLLVLEDERRAPCRSPRARARWRSRRARRWPAR